MASSARAEGFAPAKPDRTFAIVTPSDPTRFYPRSGPLPAVVSVRAQTGAWDAAGQSRTLELGDGSTVVERLTEVDAPRRFAYRLGDFSGRFGSLVAFAEAEWDFDASVEGTRIRWTYTFHAQPKRGWVVRLIVVLFWGRYMNRVLPGLIEEVRRVAGSARER
ncbi:MAG TPA: SRPBCC family protein [Solirubrobacteraceae bacterium]|nr:SRPBCC family protein [Solirubrobacteraceae bacterium]